jgi:hypothetical protein
MHPGVVDVNSTELSISRTDATPPARWVPPRLHHPFQPEVATLCRVQIEILEVQVTSQLPARNSVCRARPSVRLRQTSHGPALAQPLAHRRQGPFSNWLGPHGIDGLRGRNQHGLVIRWVPLQRLS